MKIIMKLLSDTIFGNGESIPGGEDIALLCDEQGFPYYKGTSFKGIFREELTNYLRWTGAKDPDDTVIRLLGRPTGDDADLSGKIIFSDFKIPEAIKHAVLAETAQINEQIRPDLILNSMSHLRTFTEIDDKKGTAKENSLRIARCANRDLIFESEIICGSEDEKTVSDVLSLIKWIGSMRNRGFGKVEIKVL